jgi:hypothetical protein
LILLRVALELCQQGIPVLCLLPPGTINPLRIDELAPEVIVQLLNTPMRDYTHGDGLSLLRQLVEVGAIVIASVGEVADQARRILATGRHAV